MPHQAGIMPRSGVAMDLIDADVLVGQLTKGFESLQDEYEKLFGRHQALERKLATAREQYNELAKLYNAGASTTPPLSLSSAAGQKLEDSESPNVVDILHQQKDAASKEAAERVDQAYKAALALRAGFPALRDQAVDGVKIWSGPSADKLKFGASAMSSISESPLEQDFTIEGKPSSLGCPFASMANKKLSSHAASVLSRYNQGSAGAQSVSNSSVMRVNGKESFSRRASRRASFADPIKEEICGLSDRADHANHAEETAPVAQEVETSNDADVELELRNHVEAAENAEPGVCPIRFLDQHSPEEVATYFERHKHELPRSHEICVRRYQSDDQQVAELDAKYGNLVSMIQGLGAKHKEYLPEDPDPEEEEENSNIVDDAKVRKWASSVSPERPDDADADEERVPHFERPLREVRVGESPSRPWGISVPAKYFEDDKDADSNRAVPLTGGEEALPKTDAPKVDTLKTDRPAGGRCPFGFDQAGGPSPHQKAPEKEQDRGLGPDVSQPKEDEARPTAAHPAGDKPKTERAMPSFVNPSKPTEGQVQPASVTFAGPVFFGYNPEDAAKFLRMSGLGADSA